MPTVDLNLVQQLRARTGAGMMESKKALQEAQGDIEKAIDILRRKGIAAADRRAGYATGEGIVDAYIHPGERLGVLVEINCETDFVARTAEFKAFAHDICMHIAAFNPKYIAPEDVDQAFIAREREAYTQELRDTKKPAAVIEQIVEGKIKKLYTALCLLKQPFIKNEQLSVEEVLKGLIGKVGENIRIRRFARFEIGG
jgi:elongation factor Ts